MKDGLPMLLQWQVNGLMYTANNPKGSAIDHALQLIVYYHFDSPVAQFMPLGNEMYFLLLSHTSLFVIELHVVYVS